MMKLLPTITTLLATGLGLGEIAEFLLGGSLTVITIYLTLAMVDIVSGYAKALKDHTWLSSVNLEGLLMKFVAFTTIIAAASIDKVAPYLNVQLPVNIALIWTCLLCVYEFGSILENASHIGLKIDWLMKWLHLFEEKETQPKLENHDSKHQK